MASTSVYKNKERIPSEPTIVFVTQQVKLLASVIIFQRNNDCILSCTHVLTHFLRDLWNQKDISKQKASSVFPIRFEKRKI